MEVDKRKKPSMVEVCMADLFSTDEELAATGYTPVVVKQLFAHTRAIVQTKAVPQACLRTMPSATD